MKNSLKKRTTENETILTSINTYLKKLIKKSITSVN